MILRSDGLGLQTHFPIPDVGMDQPDTGTSSSTAHAIAENSKSHQILPTIHWPLSRFNHT